jgi:glycosyltransferase involved in cell wall biosynthesis
MIVKNESHIIHECLNSVYKLIDYWVIVDTGSTDGTQDIIRKFFEEKGIPGELHESEWKGFGKSRTEALSLCKGKADYVYMIDADDYLQGQFKLPPGTEIDSFALRLGREEFSWWRNQIFSMKEDWEYVGILHEYPRCISKPQPIMSKLEGNYRVVARTIGGRNVGVTAIEKYSKDAEILEKALIEEPQNNRYQFYLGQSYFDSQQWEKAIAAYEKRIDMGGWPEEVFYSLYRIGVAKSMLSKPPQEVIDAFLRAYQYRPIRAEPLYHISQIYRVLLQMPAVAYTFAKAAMDIPYPVGDILFVPDVIYKFAIIDEVCATAAYAGHATIGYNAGKRLLEEGNIPVSELPRIHNNIKHYEEILKDHLNFVRQEENKKKNEPVKTKKYKKRK